MIVGPFTATVPAGGTGVVLETAPIEGIVLEIGLEPTFDDGTSMDITIATKGTSSLTKTLLTLSNFDTALWYPVRRALVGTDGVALTGQYSAISVTDPLEITIAGAGAGDQLNVWLELL
jgi:hypothetical protein